MERGASTPFTSPPDVANTTMDLVELDNSYENDLLISNRDGSVNPSDETVIHNTELSQDVRNLIKTLTGPMDTEKRKRNPDSPEDLPPAKASTINTEAQCREIDKYARGNKKYLS